MTANITFTGLSTGVDWTSIVKELVQAYSYPITEMNAQVTSYQNKITSVQSLNTQMSSLDKFVQSVNTPSQFRATTATSSDTGVLTATSDGTATPGAHTVTVGSGIPDVLASQGVATNSTVVSSGAGTMTIYVGSSHIDVSVTNGMTLSGLQTAIEAADPGNILTAEIIDDGSSSNPKRLSLTANSGGSSNLVSVTANPTSLNFSENCINPVTNGAGWTGSSQATSSGNYTGSTNQQYTFTVKSVNGGAGTGTLGTGTDQIVVHWQNADDSSNGDITLDASNYTPGTPVDVGNDGLQVAFSAGTLSTDAGNNFTVDTFSNVDSVQNGTWSGASSVTSAGHYLGSTNKTFNFSVVNSGTVGTNQIGIKWSDTEGNTGVITIPNNYTAGENLDVYQGLQTNLSAGNLVAGNTFSINVFSPHIQQGQDSGLAQAEQVVHSGFTDTNTTPVTSSNATFSYTYGGKPESVSVPAGTTLAQLANLINTDAGNPGVTASILNDGRGLSTSYHLELAGNNTGAAYTITDIQDTFTGGTFSSSGFSVAQQAENAMVQVDGYPPGTSQYIQRSSNSVSDLIPGVTLSLVAPGTTNVNISADTSTIQNTIQNLVNSVNSVLDNIAQATKYDSTTNTTGVMIGSLEYESIRQQINDIMTSPIPGLTDGVDPYTTLAQIGITPNADTGDWQIDSATLNNALTSNLAGVEKLFVQDGTNGTGLFQLLTQKMAQLDDSVSGPLNILLNSYNGEITDINNNITSEQARVDQYQQSLQTQFASLETSLGQLNQQGAALTNWINQLSNITPGSSTSSTSSTSGTSGTSSTSGTTGTSSSGTSS